MEVRLTSEEVADLQSSGYVKYLMEEKNRVRMCLGGDSSSQIDSPPSWLVLSVPTVYQQANRNYCISYSFASCLHYCGFPCVARTIASFDDVFSTIPLDYAFSVPENLILAHLLLIGQPTKYNTKGKRKITIKDLIQEKTPYPTILVPIGRNGYCGHCVLVVNDIIFDAITPFGLLLIEESFEWVFGVPVKHILMAYRFANKAAPKGTKIHGTFKRKIVYHTVQQK